MIGIDKGKVRKHFDRHALEYDDYAVVQHVMADRLLGLAINRKAPETVKSIIELGCGTGGLTGSLLKAYPQAHIAAIDLSPRMAALTRERYETASNGRLEVQVGDAEFLAESDCVPTGGEIDLIISNATFQWFNDPVKTAKQWLRHLAPGGVLAVASFGPRTFYELHEAFSAAEAKLGLLPQRHGQEFVALTEWECAVAGEAPFYGEEACYIESFPDVFTFLHRVKRIGAGNANQESMGTLRGGRRLFTELEKIYRERFADDQGRLRATYHKTYGLIGPTPVWRINLF